MSRDFLNDIPEQFRAIYDKATEPNPMRTHFETLKKMEELKDKVRSTSVLYKEIFQETMFGFLTIDGALNLDIKVFVPCELYSRLFEESRVCGDRYVALLETGDDFTSVTLTDKETAQTRDVKIVYKSKPLIDEISQFSINIEEALIDLQSKYGVDNGDEVLIKTESVYLNREDRKDIQGMERMLASLTRVDSPTNNSSDINKRQYFRHALKAKPFRLTMARINWNQEYRSL